MKKPAFAGRASSVATDKEREKAKLVIDEDKFAKALARNHQV